MKKKKKKKKADGGETKKKTFFMEIFFILFWIFSTSLKRKNRLSEVFCKIGVLIIWQNSQKNVCAGVSFLIKIQPGCLQFYLKGTPV